MTVKTILAPVDGSPQAKPAMELAFKVGRNFSANVCVFHARLDSKAAVPLLGEGMSGAMIEEMIDLAEKEGADQARAAQTMFNNYCLEHGISLAPGKPGGQDHVSATWREEEGREDDLLARVGRLHDLVVVGRPVEDGDHPSELVLNAVLFETGRPVLVAPPALPAHFGTKIAIAWNGSAEAARAVGAAMPFLKQANAVSILTVRTDKTATSTAEALAEHLAWHGVMADPVEFSPAGHDVGEAMLLECRKVHADMIVMGAYTYSRMRQLILGGVTRYVLDHADLPVLMAH